MAIIRHVKKRLYFVGAYYFKFWAAFYLKRWHPTVITVIGSSGKTTILHLLEAQIGDKAYYSHKANSAFGIPFNILGIDRTTFRMSEWLWLLVSAPFKAFGPVRSETIYVTEADSERPGEGRLLAHLLKPDYVIWISLEEAHGINYDSVAHPSEPDVRKAVKQAMADEFGLFIKNAQQAVVLNVGNEFINNQQSEATCDVIAVLDADVKEFVVKKNDIFVETSTNETYFVPALLPPQAGLSVLSVVKVLQKIGLAVDKNFTAFTLPPSRSSVFEGKKGTTIIDSSYNATIDGVRTMLDLMKRYPASGEKWLVLGDMIEQGKSEELEHNDLAELIKDLNPDRVVFVGPRLGKYTYPLLIPTFDSVNIHQVLMPADALEYLEKELKGGETILFKGARYLEGIVEKMLAHKEDSSKLCRREAVWVERRKQWGI